VLAFDRHCFRAVDGNNTVGGGIIGRSSGDLEAVVVCHNAVAADWWSGLLCHVALSGREETVRIDEWDCKTNERLRRCLSRLKCDE